MKTLVLIVLAGFTTANVFKLLARNFQNLGIEVVRIDQFSLENDIGLPARASRAPSDHS